MTIVRLFKKVLRLDPATGELTEAKKYVSKHFVKDKAGLAQAKLTNNKKMAMVFESTESVVQFHFLFDAKDSKVKMADLQMEYEEIDKTFEEAFGHDPDKKQKQEMIHALMTQDQYQADIAVLEKRLDVLYATEESEEITKEQLVETIELLEKELDVKQKAFNAFMEKE